MMNRAAYAISLWLSIMCGPTSGATFIYLVGDDDGFGGQLPADNRSVAEAASTDGAQFTDFSETGFGTFAFTGQDPVFINGVATAAPAGPDSLFVTFNIDMFETISSIDVSMFTLGIQDNFPTSATGGG